MIFLYTDFGWAGPYVGEMKAVLARELPNVALVDLMHDAPAFNPRASAYLLAALSKRFVEGDLCVAVVDPGVGDTNRRAIMLEADGIRFVGPDNGLFAVVACQAKRVRCEEILWRPVNCSDSFHGRDVFAPVASQWHRGSPVESRTASPDSLVGMEFPEQLAEVIYIDHFGNAVTGLNAKNFPLSARLLISDQRIAHAPTFSRVAAGEMFWYANSMGLVEIAANRVNAAEQLDLRIGTHVDFIL